MDGPPPTDAEDTRSPEDKTRFSRELLEILSELRVALPGVQILFAFLLTVPFSARFPALGPVGRGVFFLTLLCAATASALLIAPSVYHRLHWRAEVRDRELMLRTFNRLVVAGSLFLALAMVGLIFVLTDFLYGRFFSMIAIVLSGALFAWLWYGLPLSRRTAGRRAGQRGG